MKKPKIAVAQKPTPKAEQPVVSVDAATKPKKITPSQKSTKKAKAVTPKAVAEAVEAGTPKHAVLPSGSVWPNWVENLLMAIGVMKK